MNRIILALAVPLLTVACATNSTQNVNISYTCDVATWQGFATSAISYTYDDGCPNQFSTAAPLMDKYGFKGTFYLVTQWLSDWSTFAECAQNGHEIASHTLTHPNLCEISVDSATAELSQSQQLIIDNTGTECFSIAYPYCAKPDETLVSQYYGAARICDCYIEGATPRNYLAISSFGIGSESTRNNAESVISLFEQTAEKGGWCVLLIHEIDDGPGYSPFSSAALDTTLQYLDAHRDQFWTATFSDVAKYARERDAAQITLTTASDKQINISIATGLSSDIYNVPLTLKLTLPDDWTGATVEQHGATTEISASDGTIVFDAQPDGSTVTVRKL